MKIAAIVNSSVSMGCPFCRGSRLNGLDDFEGAARHLQDEHGLVCMHVGTETTNDSDGKPWHNTVAVFGAENPPSPLPVPKIKLDL
jgi:hypothetical protein